MHAKLKGFTLIELVVAIAIVLLLIAVAAVSYQDHMSRNARLHARQVMLELSGWLLQQHGQIGSYRNMTLPYSQSPRDGDAEYRISLLRSPVRASDPAVEFAATADAVFTLQAVPVDEDACGTLLLDQSGRKGVVAASASLADCWQ